MDVKLNKLSQIAIIAESNYATMMNNLADDPNIDDIKIEVTTKCGKSIICSYKDRRIRGDKNA